jgi:hypothetical protein
MPIAAALAAVIDLICVIHIVRTNRPQYWIYVVLAVPILGALCYVLFEAIPNTPGAQKAQRKIDRALKDISRAIAPDAELAKRIAEVESCGSIENKIKLAEECLESGHAEEARRLYAQCLVGAYAADPNLKLGLVKAEFAANDLVSAKASAERLLADHPGYKTGEVKLALARIHELQGEINAAEGYYAEAMRAYPGEAARYYYAMMLKSLGRAEQARSLFETIVENADRATALYRDQEAAWIKGARRELSAPPIPPRQGA